MIKNIILSTLALFIVVSFLPGCGRKDKDKVHLRFISWGNEREEKSLRSLIAEFEKKHPNIEVELQITPWGRMFDRLMISTAGGRPPDVTRVSSIWFHACAAKKLFEPLDAYVERDNYDMDDFYKEPVEGWGKYKGTLYSIPTDNDVYALYYNKTMFDKYKLPYPDWSWDWNKLLEVAKKLTKDFDGDGRLDQWGLSPDMNWQDYVYQNGGRLVSEDLTKCTLHDPRTCEAIQWHADLINKHHVSPNAEESAEVGNRNLFTSGKIGMYVSGSWDAALFFKDQIKDFEYDVGPLPKGKYRVTYNGGSAYAILSRSPHKEEAWEFVKWMTGPEYMRQAAENSDIIPSRKSVAESGAYLMKKDPPKNRQVFLDMIPYSLTDLPISVAPEMNQLMNAELALVMLGKQTAKDMARKVTPKIDQLLRNKDE